MRFRKYGDTPYTIAIVHGGPGALGDAKPMCETLSETRGVIEPLLGERTIEGQIQALKRILEENMEGTATLIGHSWGAMLVFMFAGRYPKLVRKIVMISSGPLEKAHAAVFRSHLEKRLTKSQMSAFQDLQNAFTDASGAAGNEKLAEMGEFMEQVNSYKLVHSPYDGRLFDHQTFISISKEMQDLRKSGAMFEMGKTIQCAVTAIHGDHDAHPQEAVRESLRKLDPPHRFYLLEKCGHTPWKEHHARKNFYAILVKELIN